jgi:preprotein translocase subunit YajC
MSFAAILFPFLIVFFLVFLIWMFFAIRRRRKRKKLAKAELESLRQAAKDGSTIEFRR